MKDINPEGRELTDRQWRKKGKNEVKTIKIRRRKRLSARPKLANY